MRHALRTLSLSAALLLGAALIPSCPGGGQITDTYVAMGPGNVDMLWILDASGSMADAQAQLSGNFHRFVEGLPETSNTQMAVTTPQAWPCNSYLASSSQCTDDVGTAGRIRREGNSVALMDPSDDHDQEQFRALAHVGIYGDGFERPMQTALMAMCEALDLPAETDFVEGTDTLKDDFPFGCSGENWDPEHEYYEACRCLPLELNLSDDDGNEWTETLHNANLGMLRGDNPLHVVVLTDEGDQTHSMENLGAEACAELTGDELCSCQLDEVLRLMRTIVPELRVSSIGPGQGRQAPEDEQYFCNPMGSTVCSIDFLMDSVDITDGFYHPILTPLDGDQDQCENAELAQALAELVLFHPSVEWYQLTGLPDPETIQVRRENIDVPEVGEGTTCTGAELGSGGWSYIKEKRAVSLVGDCTAYAGQLIEITYETAGPLIFM